ncbi:DEAD/DEAH box helicase family protein [Neisseriaceae bacterium B1]
MQLKFENQEYQMNAVNAVVRLFQGEPNHAQADFELTAQYDGLSVPNVLRLVHDEIGKNLNTVQKDFRQPETEIGQYGMNFTVEMETGTGKTYVYLRTIFQLNQQYGWKKFVIVVPSVAIREGVKQSIRAMTEHFQAAFDGAVFHSQVYSSDRLNALKNFASSNEIEILIINIDAFKKDSEDDKDSKNVNVINRVNESGVAPIEHIRETRPIVIIDEPQNMETDLAKQAIDKLNPLFVLRYSATHKNPYHKIYSLNPIEAYQQKLVKQIVVEPVLAKNDVNGAYVVLKEIVQGKGSLKAKVEIHFNDKKEMKKKVVTVQSSSLKKQGDDLFDKSGGNESYRYGFLVEGIDAEQEQIAFSNGQIVTKGEDQDALRDEIMKKQIECTIKEHLKNEKKLNPRGIKVLSLFFIDKVANYRNDGKFARWFKEIYERETGESADGVHDGYFSQDKGKDKDTNGSSKADEETYDLIMRDKEKLLSFGFPLRFIFSHSALKEGWDNPNVFQICTLNETHSPIKKRQEIGRGLRLAVNQQGERVRDESVNILTVIPNESYESFAANLQKEYEDECGIKFTNGGVKNNRDKTAQNYRKGFTLDPHFVAIWEQIRHKTRYEVQFSRDELIQAACKAVKAMPKIDKPKIVVQKAKIEQSITYGIEAKELNSQSHELDFEWQIPDILGEIQKKTQLTRQTIFEIIQQSERVAEMASNPQRFIDLVSEKIWWALHGLMIDGIEYFRLPEQDYAQSLAKWEYLEQYGAEFFKNQYTFAVNNSAKTIFADYISLDSDTEKDFALACEHHEDVLLYFKLPSWFKIPTPIGAYNPDWAIVKQGAEHVYFVAETKNTGKGIQEGVDLDKLSLDEQQKIACANKHFSVFDGVNYRVVQKLSEL